MESGLTGEQAKKAFDFYRAEDARLTEEVKSQNVSYFKEAWGVDYEKERSTAEKAVKFYETKIPELGESVKKGLGYNVGFVKLMAHLGKAISEADVSGGGNGTGDVAMTPEEFYGQKHPKIDS